MIILTQVLVLALYRGGIGACVYAFCAKTIKTGGKFIKNSMAKPLQLMDVYVKIYLA
jgi:soluble P-type ATPase